MKGQTVQTALLFMTEQVAAGSQTAFVHASTTGTTTTDDVVHVGHSVLTVCVGNDRVIGCLLAAP